MSGWFASTETKSVSAMIGIVRYIAGKNHVMEGFPALVDLNIHLGCKRFGSHNATTKYIL